MQSRGELRHETPREQVRLVGSRDARRRGRFVYRDEQHLYAAAAGFGVTATEFSTVVCVVTSGVANRRITTAWFETSCLIAKATESNDYFTNQCCITLIELIRLLFLPLLRQNRKHRIK
jgi:hypothetical protein